MEGKETAVGTAADAAAAAVAAVANAVAAVGFSSSATKEREEAAHSDATPNASSRASPAAVLRRQVRSAKPSLSKAGSTQPRSKTEAAASAAQSFLASIGEVEPLPSVFTAELRGSRSCCRLELPDASSLQRPPNSSGAGRFSRSPSCTAVGLWAPPRFSNGECRSADSLSRDPAKRWGRSPGGFGNPPFASPPSLSSRPASPSGALRLGALSATPDKHAATNRWEREGFSPVLSEASPQGQDSAEKQRSASREATQKEVSLCIADAAELAVEAAAAASAAVEARCFRKNAQLRRGPAQQGPSEQGPSEQGQLKSQPRNGVSAEDEAAAPSPSPSQPSGGSSSSSCVKPPLAVASPGLEAAKKERGFFSPDDAGDGIPSVFAEAAVEDLALEGFGGAFSPRAKKPLFSAIRRERKWLALKKQKSREPSPPPFPRATPRLKVATLGSEGSGKSCLVRQFCERRFAAASSEEETAEGGDRRFDTICVDFGPCDVRLSGGLEARLHFFDLSGAAEFWGCSLLHGGALLRESGAEAAEGGAMHLSEILVGSDVVLCVFDCTSELSLAVALDLLRSVKALVAGRTQRTQPDSSLPPASSFLANPNATPLLPAKRLSVCRPGVGRPRGSQDRPARRVSVAS